MILSTHGLVQIALGQKLRAIPQQAGSQHQYTIVNRTQMNQYLAKIRGLNQGQSRCRRCCLPADQNLGIDGGDDGGSKDKNERNTKEDDGDDEQNEVDKVSILTLASATKIATEAGIKLPKDFVNVAENGGLRSSALQSYISFQEKFFEGFLTKHVPWIRDRMIQDEKFLFKVALEVIIDTGCATFAEVRKRGDKFMEEIEFYMSDMLVGWVMDVTLVTLLAPVATLGSKPRQAQYKGIMRYVRGLPSSVFEASQPGVKRFFVQDRLACFVVKAMEYSLAGILCGFVGQGLANQLMVLRRQVQGESEHDVAIPPVGMTALTWGLFMGVSSNIRYNIVNGLERVVDQTIARQYPDVAYVTSTCIRFYNNVIGGENFIDIARWTGVQ